MLYACALVYNKVITHIFWSATYLCKSFCHLKCANRVHVRCNDGHASMRGFGVVEIKISIHVNLIFLKKSNYNKTHVFLILS